MAELTTVQIDLETDRKLKAIAAAYERSKPAQVRFWVTREYAELERLKLLPVEPDERPAPTEPSGLH
jgi:predicted transcriptional regulator